MKKFIIITISILFYLNNSAMMDKTILQQLTRAIDDGDEAKHVYSLLQDVKPIDSHSPLVNSAIRYLIRKSTTDYLTPGKTFLINHCYGLHYALEFLKENEKAVIKIEKETVDLIRECSHGEISSLLETSFSSSSTEEQYLETVRKISQIERDRAGTLTDQQRHFLDVWEIIEARYATQLSKLVAYTNPRNLPGSDTPTFSTFLKYGTGIAAGAATIFIIYDWLYPYYSADHSNETLADELSS